jgi:hypothetical protein
MIISVPVQTAVLAKRALGELTVLVGVQVSLDGLYLAPVIEPPPHTIISLPVQTALWLVRALGAFVVLSGVHVSVEGLYLAPVLVEVEEFKDPPQTIISMPVQTALWLARGLGALVMLTGVQPFTTGLYLAPVLVNPPPPQMIISLPVQTAVFPMRELGAPVRVVASQVSVTGLYFPPELKLPPQTIISFPVQTALCRIRGDGALTVLVAVQELSGQDDGKLASVGSTPAKFDVAPLKDAATAMAAIAMRMAETLMYSAAAPLELSCFLFIDRWAESNPGPIRCQQFEQEKRTWHFRHFNVTGTVAYQKASSASKRCCLRSAI